MVSKLKAKKLTNNHGIKKKLNPLHIFFFVIFRACYNLFAIIKNRTSFCCSISCVHIILVWCCSMTSVTAVFSFHAFVWNFETLDFDSQSLKKSYLYVDSVHQTGLK